MKVRYELTITENSGRVVTPAYETDVLSDPGQSWVEDFFGCNEPDVIDFSVKRVVLN